MLSFEKNRNRTADLLKGIAVILMIQVHLMELFAIPEIYASWIGKISLFLGGPPAAPVFMGVMGYYFAMSKRTFISSFFRGIKLILLGFILNIGLNLHLFIKIADGTIETSPWPYVFGVDILFLAGFSLIILSFIKKIFDLKLLPYLLILGLIFIIQLFPFPISENQYLQYLQAYFAGKEIWWSYFPIIPWLAYPTIGFILFIIMPRLVSQFDALRLYLLLIFGILFMVFINYGIEISSMLPEYYHHGFLFFLFTCSFLIFYSIIIHLISGQKEIWLTRWVEWLGINVTAAYVVQWLVIGNIATAVYKTQGLLPLVFWFIVVLIVTSAGVLLWNKINRKGNLKNLN